MNQAKNRQITRKEARQRAERHVLRRFFKGAMIVDGYFHILSRDKVSMH